MKKGFTLIELLIVIAIIAILALIAIPNFLEAQVRAKVSRVKADFRSIATGVEAYRVDCQTYPTGWPGNPANRASRSLAVVTTPIAYMTGVQMTDPFRPDPANNRQGDYLYMSYEYNSSWRYSINGGTSSNYPANLAQTQTPYAAFAGYSLTSWGPDRAQEGLEYLVYNRPIRTNDIYDATNGVVSRGGIAYFGGSLPAWACGAK